MIYDAFGYEVAGNRAKESGSMCLVPAFFRADGVSTCQQSATEFNTEEKKYWFVRKEESKKELKKSLV